MRLTVLSVLFAMLVVMCADTKAQIPENARFAAGSYARPYYYQQPYQYAPIVSPPVGAENKAAAVAEEEETESENEDGDDAVDNDSVKKVSENAAAVFSPLPAPTQPVPYLTFVYDRWNHRFHITAHEPGYAASPTEFPQETSPLNIWVSSLSSQAIPQQQIRYMSYYDPDPVVLPAQIRLWPGSGMAAQNPIPLPVPKPSNARSVDKPAKTRLGSGLRQTNLGQRLRNTFGEFTVQ